ncbi:DExH-box splicing factor binding site-domain-containing protein [Kickxella alabastrina]|uniref:DExH-box splicing factor binding site-domain-containing protein n=1 Tax=Kickxella alabastrina TaxID=61397 RepID=UPI0022201844|nr:DExH-box splicing factor binding site-domain-containing protein [Kickxella alabastrina]KAI7824442.1 DExH-box splicing factor binding site-domain-containing protein [Kickxella alabastrina]
MRKSGAGKVVKKPIGSVLSSSTTAFKGFKLEAAAPLKKPQAFGAECDDTNDKQSSSKLIVGVQMAILGEQGDRIVSKEEEDASRPLVILAKRNANWMEKKDKGEFGLVVSKRQEKKEKRVERSDILDRESEQFSLRQQAINDLMHGGDLGERSGQEKHMIITADSDADLSDDVDDQTYERVPIESFGAAMLRGMGWKDDIGDKSAMKDDDKSFVARPSLLGLGAQPRPSDTVSSDKARPKRF